MMKFLIACELVRIKYPTLKSLKDRRAIVSFNIKVLNRWY